MFGRHDAAGEGPNRPALAVRRPDAGSRDRLPVNRNNSADVDPLAGKRHDGLDERCETAGAKTVPQIAAIARFDEGRRRRGADKHEIPNRDSSLERLD